MLLVSKVRENLTSPWDIVTFRGALSFPFFTPDVPSEDFISQLTLEDGFALLIEDGDYLLLDT